MEIHTFAIEQLSLNGGNILFCRTHIDVSGNNKCKNI